MLFQLLSFLCVVSSALGDHWGVIVAGSNTYGNYRHQADACHAYQILHKNGIPDNRIIMMMYDDIANNPQNPVKGNIINKPNGPDVYKGVPKDYTGKDVTSDKFLKIIQGDTTAGGKVLNSGPDDNVFIYFTDHGAPGFVAFPSTTLKATDFVNAIKKMNLKKMYKKMAVYIEACEAGSMFDNLLPNNIQVYATTAANPRESSYAFYWDATRKAYLGDEYSINWMEDSDVADMKTETLNEQFITTRNKTKESHVMQYGDNSIQDTVIGAFQGNVAGFTPRMPSRNTKSLPAMCRSTHDAVRSENVKIATLQRSLESENDAVLREQISNELNQELRRREEVDQVFHDVARRVTGSSFEASRMISNRDYNSIPFECYNPLIDFVQENCFFLPQDEWASNRMHVLVKLCEEGYSSAAISAALSEVCSPQMKANLL